VTAETSQDYLENLTDDAAETRRRSRRLFWWLIVIPLLAVVLPVLIALIRQQQTLHWIESVEARGGRVVTVKDHGNRLRELVGNRSMMAFDQVTAVELVNATNADLRRVVRTKNLSRTEDLILKNPRLSEAGWELLGELKALRFLEIRDDASLLRNRELLPRLERLRHLVIGDISLSGVSEIDNLALLPRLEQPTFVDVPLSHAQIEAISRLAHLTGLGIIGTPLDREDVVELQSLTRLRSLDLTETNLPDAALPELVEFKQLQFLNLSKNPISTAALEPLGAMQQLRRLYFVNMTTTGEVFDPSSLVSALPDCEILVPPSLEGTP